MAFWKKKKEEEATETPVEGQKLDVDPQSVVPESLSVIRLRRPSLTVLIMKYAISIYNPPKDARRQFQ